MKPLQLKKTLTDAKRIKLRMLRIFEEFIMNLFHVSHSSMKTLCKELWTFVIAAVQQSWKMYISKVFRRYQILHLLFFRHRWFLFEDFFFFCKSFFFVTCLIKKEVVRSHFSHALRQVCWDGSQTFSSTVHDVVTAGTHGRTRASTSAARLRAWRLLVSWRDNQREGYA